MRRSLRSVPGRPAVEDDPRGFAVILPGRSVDDPVARKVAEHALELYERALEEVPGRGAVVRTFLAEYARAAALCGWCEAEAVAQGLDSGQAHGLMAMAAKKGAQAERALESAWSHARRVAAEGSGGDEGGEGFVVVPGASPGKAKR